MTREVALLQKTSKTPLISEKQPKMTKKIKIFAERHKIQSKKPSAFVVIDANETKRHPNKKMDSDFDKKAQIYLHFLKKRGNPESRRKQPAIATYEIFRHHRFWKKV